MLKRIILSLLVVSVVLGALAVAAWRQLEHYLDRPIAGLDTPVDVLVAPGSSVTRVIHQLSERGLLQYPDLLVIYLRLTQQTQVQAGEYSIATGMTPRELLAHLAEGDVKHYQVTLLEGWTLKQALAHLEAQDVLVHELDEAGLVGFLQGLGIADERGSAEGLFFPDTYRYVRGMSDRDLLATAYDKMQQTLAAEWPKRVKDLPLSSPYEALVLASIVEKETAVDSEREQIAGVFIERLERGMRLQTDPTVIYAMGDSYQGNIRRKDLKLDSPYNTYRVKGLPPTPIALPSQRSIEAVLNPLRNGKLYFVARGDGSHHFSATLEEHNRAVQEYQVRNRKKNYRSVPTQAKTGESANGSS